MSNDPRFPNGPPLYGCATCSKDYASEAAFDMHREWTEEPGDWTRRSCMAVQSDPNWVQDKNGRWTTAKLAAQAKQLREYHRDAA